MIIICTLIQSHQTLSLSPLRSFHQVVLPELAAVRITAYEEGGKFVGHRVLPVIGLCPGYRHVNLRNELGQPLLMATLFLCIVVKDYVPDGLSDFADALANPIKYQSQLEKRAEQLAVLTDDIEPIAEDEATSVCKASSAASKGKADTLPRGQQSFTLASSSALAGGSMDNGAEYGGLGSSCTDHNVSGTGGSSLTAGGGASSSSTGPSTSTSQPGASAVVQGSSSSDVASAAASTAVTPFKSLEAVEADAMRAEPLECLLAHKLIREKRQEMEKKLESLRKKHDKEKLRICASPKTGESSSSSDKKSKFHMGNKLVKRLSSKSM